MKDLQLISSRAASRNLPFLLAGGYAVIAHGAPRATFDVDFVVRRTDRLQWIAFADEIGYGVLRETSSFVQFNPSDPGQFAFDLILVNDETFQKMGLDSVPAPYGVAGMRIVSLMHLLALKCHAVKHGHSGRLIKDADDVIRLIKNNRVDLASDQVRELFLKHGTEEFYEKVKRAAS